MEDKQVKPDKLRLIREVVEDVEKDLGDEEMIHRVLHEKVSAKEDEPLTLGQRAADRIAKFAGSWRFITVFISVLAIWMAFNAFALARAFDPYPFILLNLVLSCVAAIQAPLIMMSQNRQEEKDRRRAENDYRVNLKSEIIVEDLHEKLDELIENQQVILEYIKDKK